MRRSSYAVCNGPEAEVQVNRDRNAVLMTWAARTVSPASTAEANPWGRAPPRLSGRCRRRRLPHVRHAYADNLRGAYSGRGAQPVIEARPPGTLGLLGLQRLLQDDGLIVQGIARPE